MTRQWRVGRIRDAAWRPEGRRSSNAMLLLCVGLTVIGGTARAAEPPPSTTELETVVVTATRLPEPLGEVPASLSVVDREDIQEARPGVGLEEALPRVPGVLVQSSGNFAQDARIQIRGFGTRAAFGVREVKVLVDGLPETLPDGQTQLDNVDLGAVDRIEVLRGPASSLYGNAAGGVIQIFTEDGTDPPSAEIRATGGSFGLAKTQVKGGGRAGPVSLFVHSSFLRLDGFRHQSETESGIVNLKLRYDVDDATGVTLLVNGVDSPTAEDPGGLQRDVARAHPASASPRNVQLDAGEEVEQGRIGVVADHAGDVFQLSGYGYLLYRDFDSRLPVLPDDGDGAVTFHRVSPGGGVRSTWSAALADWKNALTVGVDAQYQDDRRRRYANVDGERGELHVKQREQVTGVGVYVREAVKPRDGLELSAGARYDSVHYDVDVAQSLSPEDEGSRTLDAWSPAAGILYMPHPWVSLFANIGTAFQVPTTTELGNPTGPGFNRDIDPQTAVSYEIGGRAERGSRLSGGLSGFAIDVEDELIPFESPPGHTAFRNAGRSLRYGLELDWRAELASRLTWTNALTLLKAEYRDYRTGAGTFDGNDEPGIPPWQVYEELAYRQPSGLYAALEAFVVGRYAVDDANQHHSPAYALVNLRAGYERTWERWAIEPFVGLLNLADQHYEGTVRINAQGGRFFEPAPGFNVYGGVALSARL